MNLTVSQVNYCANECARQLSGEKAVAGMILAYHYLQVREQDNAERLISAGLLITLAATLEPNLNGKYRAKWENQKLLPHHISTAIDALCVDQAHIGPDEIYNRLMYISPFQTGNYRLASLIWNYLRGTLAEPELAGDWFKLWPHDTN